MHFYFSVASGVTFFIFQCMILYKAERALGQISSDWDLWRNQKSNKRRGREELLRRFDQLIHTNIWRLILRRLSVMAPLLGVILTAAGFMWGDIGPVADNSTLPQSSSSNFRDVLQSFTPLYIGLLTGVILAFINQVLLCFLDHWASRVREVCEKNAGKTGNDPVNFALEEFADTIQKISTLAESQLETAVTGSEAKIQTLGNSMSTVTSLLETIAKDYQASQDAMKQVTADMHAAILTTTSQLATETATIRSSCKAMSDEFQSIAKSLKANSGSVKSAGRTFANTVKRFDPILDNVNDQMKSFTTSAAQFQTASQEAVAQTQRHGKEMKASLDQAAAGIQTAAAECRSTSTSLKNAGDHVGSSAKSLQGASATLQKSTETFKTQIPELHQSLDSLSQSIQRQEKTLTTAPDQLAGLLQSIEATLTTQVKQHAKQMGTDLHSDLEPAIQKASGEITKAAQECNNSTRLLESVIKKLPSGLMSLEDNSEALIGSTEQLSGQIEGLQQSIGELSNNTARQDKTLDRLVQSLKDTLSNAQRARSKSKSRLDSKNGDHDDPSRETVAVGAGGDATNQSTIGRIFGKLRRKPR